MLLEYSCWLCLSSTNGITLDGYLTGTVWKWSSANKGFGFISPEDGVVPYWLSREFTGNVDSNRAEAGGWILEGERELAIL
jgi:hypothetical protein